MWVHVEACVSPKSIQSFFNWPDYFASPPKAMCVCAWARALPCDSCRVCRPSSPLRWCWPQAWRWWHGTHFEFPLKWRPVWRCPSALSKYGGPPVGQEEQRLFNKDENIINKTLFQHYCLSETKFLYHSITYFCCYTLHTPYITSSWPNRLTNKNPNLSATISHPHSSPFLPSSSPSLCFSPLCVSLLADR